MGCCNSRSEREEMVTRCRDRKRYMKQLTRARQSFSASHSAYMRSLRTTGSALLRFATTEFQHHLDVPQPHSFSMPPRNPPPMSPTSMSWTTSTTASTAAPPPPPPQFYNQTTSSTSSIVKPPPPGSEWDFWEPFVPGIETPTSAVSGIWKEESSGSELAMVVINNKSKDLVEIIKELDEYFIKAAQAGAQVSDLLQVTGTRFSDPLSIDLYGERKISNPVWTFRSWRKLDGFGNIESNYLSYGDGSTSSHRSTLERLHAWEKKLYHEVKNAHKLKMDHEKRTIQLRKLELKRAEYVKTEKTKKEIEKLESRIMVASQAIETTSTEIIRVRESELYPQLINLIKGLVGMWRSLYEYHQVQTHIVRQLKYINTIPSMEPTSEIHRQSTLQLELEVQQWHRSFCHIVKSQRDYIQSLMGWLRLSLFQFVPLSKTPQDSLIYSLSEEWQLSMDRIPDKVASEGIKGFLTVIHAIVIQQDEEQKQKKKLEVAFREFEKKAGKLRSIESKYRPYAISDSFSKEKDSIVIRRASVETLKAKAEEEKSKHEKAVSVTRSMTMKNLQMGLPHLFEAVTGFATAFINAYEAVYTKSGSGDEFHEAKRLLP